MAKVLLVIEVDHPDVSSLPRKWDWKYVQDRVKDSGWKSYVGLGSAKSTKLWSAYDLATGEQIWKHT